MHAALSEITLTDSEDIITWRWTSNGQYIVASAYEAQFKGSITYFLAENIWKAQCEPRCRFFTCLALHDRVLTSDNLVKRNWPHNEFCQLCYSVQETTAHLLTECNFREALWNLLAQANQLPTYMEMADTGEGPISWVQKMLDSGVTKHKRKKLGIPFTVWWHIWKERNRRTFEGVEKSIHQVHILISEALKHHRLAFPTEQQ